MENNKFNTSMFNISAFNTSGFNNSAFNTSALVAMNRELADSVLYMTVIVSAIGITGFIGNICVLIVYSYNYPKCNFKYFVITLAIIDITSCLTTVPGEIFTHRNWYNYPDNAIWFCKMKTYFNGFTVFLLAFVLLLIATDRYRKACQPLKWQIRPRLAIQLTVMSFAVAFICSIPALFLWGKHTAQVTYKGQIVMIQMCEKADEFKDTVYPSIFVYFVFFLPVICFMVSTAVLYALIIRKISICSTYIPEIYPNISTISKVEMMKKLENKLSTDSEARVKTEDEIYDSEENTPRLSRKNQKTTIMHERNPRKRLLHSAKGRMKTKTMIMFILTVVFFITTMIYFSILSLVATKDIVFVLEMEDKSDVLFLFWRLYFVNHVINPVIYGFMDPRFRQALRLGFFTNKRYLRWLSTRVESRHIQS